MLKWSIYEILPLILPPMKLFLLMQEEGLTI